MILKSILNDLKPILKIKFFKIQSWKATTFYWEADQCSLVTCMKRVLFR